MFLRIFYFQVTLVVGWIISATLILAPFYMVTLPIVTNFVYDPWFDPAYSALHGPLASVGVSWIILVCTLGHGGTFVSEFPRGLLIGSDDHYGKFQVRDHELSTGSGPKNTF